VRYVALIAHNDDNIECSSDDTVIKNSDGRITFNFLKTRLNFIISCTVLNLNSLNFSSMTRGKLFTHVCLCYQTVLVLAKGRRSFMAGKVSRAWWKWQPTIGLMAVACRLTAYRDRGISSRIKYYTILIFLSIW